MGQQTEEYNEWAEHTLSELYDALFGAEERRQMLEDQPVNYYSAGYYDTYLAAMSQVWGIQACKDDIAAIRAEIDRRREEQEEAEDEMA
jgi:hypothetical protein